METRRLLASEIHQTTPRVLQSTPALSQHTLHLTHKVPVRELPYADSSKIKAQESL